MRILATRRAEAVIEQVRGLRSGALTITIGTGCCESTAPFLYEDFWPGPDQEQVGEVSGVAVYAPEYLRRLYPDDEGATIDVIDEMGESLSVETELGVRLVLRGNGVDSTGESETCAVLPAGVARPATERVVVGRPPPGLDGLRLR